MTHRSSRRSPAGSLGHLLAALAVVCAGSARAEAQTPRVQGPFAGLFGGNAGGRSTNQSLDVRGSLFGVWQDVLKPDPDLLRELDPRFQKSGTFGGASGSLTYSYQRTTRSSGFFAGASASAADYTIRPENVLASYTASTGLNAQLTRRVSFGVSGSAAYAPFYNFGSEARAELLNPLGIPGLPSNTTSGPFDQTLPGSEFGIAATYDPNVNLGAGASIRANLTRRASLDVQGDYRTVRMLETDDYAYETWSGAANFRYSITRQLTARLGYRREVSSLGTGGERFHRDGYEMGLDYGDSLAFQLTRRTQLTLAPSASVVKWNDDTHFRVNGSAMLTHSIGRTWTASASYVRDVGFVLGFDQPVLSDTAMANIGGALFRKVRWNNSVSWTRGEIGFDDAGAYTWYSATSSLSFALTRRIAIYGQYSLYQYDVPPLTTPLVTLSTFQRQSASVGLTVFAPIFSTGRGRR